MMSVIALPGPRSGQVMGGDRIGLAHRLVAPEIDMALAEQMAGVGVGFVEIQDSQRRQEMIQAPKGVWHGSNGTDGRAVGED